MSRPHSARCDAPRRPLSREDPAISENNMHENIAPLEFSTKLLCDKKAAVKNQWQLLNI